MKVGDRQRDHTRNDFVIEKNETKNRGYGRDGRRKFNKSYDNQLALSAVRTLVLSSLTHWKRERENTHLSTKFGSDIFRA